MIFDHDKFKSLVHYVCWRCNRDPSKLGAVKLNKALRVADFTSYYKTGEPITGARYVKRQFGPVPSVIVQVLNELESEGAIRTREVPFHGFTKKQYNVLVEPDESAFTLPEIEIVEAAINLVCQEHTATSISERSHDHIWKVAENGEEIPYFTIFSVPGDITEDERSWALEELETLGR
jgi:hypothetical protein